MDALLAAGEVVGGKDRTGNLTIFQASSNPLPSCPFRLRVNRVIKNFIHFLERHVVRFRNKLLCPKPSNDTEEGEIEINAIACVLCNGRRDESNNKVVPTEISIRPGYQIDRTYSQLEQVDNATPFALSQLGKISDGIPMLRQKPACKATRASRRPS